VVETPIVFDERIFGKSKRNSFDLSIAYLTSFVRFTCLRLKAVFAGDRV